MQCMPKGALCEVPTPPNLAGGFGRHDNYADLQIKGSMSVRTSERHSDRTMLPERNRDSHSTKLRIITRCVSAWRGFARFSADFSSYL